jgi:hypothetical protein
MPVISQLNLMTLLLYTSFFILAYKQWSKLQKKLDDKNLMGLDTSRQIVVLDQNTIAQRWIAYSNAILDTAASLNLNSSNCTIIYDY